MKKETRKHSTDALITDAAIKALCEIKTKEELLELLLIPFKEAVDKAGLIGVGADYMRYYRAKCKITKALKTYYNDQDTI